ncbi:MAG: DUF4157 domain-containing protein [Anaerolineae bacterium]|nr:DUF4157 domain-containing protein [Anaerolineae bacterium]
MKDGMISNATRNAAVTATVQRKCACGNMPGPTGECAECRRKRLGVQTKLRVNRPNDRYEQEADRIADAVMRSPSTAKSAPISRWSPTSAADSPTIGRMPTSNGQPLHPATRQRFETQLGHDFSQIRVHADAPAARSARTLHARAFTRGTAIVFDTGEYKPAGNRLLAHELVHVVQQRAAPSYNIVQREPSPEELDQTNHRFDTYRITADDLNDPEIIARLEALSKAQLRLYRARVTDQTVKAHIDAMLAPKPVAQVSRMSVAITAANLTSWAEASYWQHQLDQVYAIALQYEAQQRFGKRAEERDAVLSAFWRARPAVVEEATSQYINLPPAAGRGALLYRFDLQPKTGAKTKPSVTINFEREQGKSAVRFAEKPPASYKKGRLRKTDETNIVEVGFERGMEAYWRRHKEEKRQLYYWIDQQGAKFDQFVVTRTETDSGVRRTTFRVKGEKNKRNRLTYLDVEFIGLDKIKSESPPSNYRDLTGVDVLLEKAQSEPDPKLGDRLGEVWLDDIPDAERPAVKYVIVAYFQNEVRNAEVDAIIPAVGSGKRLFYSLRFRPNNDVDVERVGEEDENAQLDPDRLDIARVHGFADNMADVATLKKWLAARYPAITPTGDTVAEVQENANRELQANANTPQWFKSNYTIYVLDAAAARKRLKSSHKKQVVTAQLVGLKDYAPDELIFIEQALQTLSPKMLTALKYLHMGRQTALLKDEDGDGVYEPAANVYGKTYFIGSTRTIIMYDLFKRDKDIFIGGSEGVHLRQTTTILHEFGHAISAKSSLKIEKAFNKFVAAKGIAPFTDYAGSKPDTEFFPEAFFIFQTDPEWLRVNHVTVYDWFTKLSETGKPPK